MKFAYHLYTLKYSAHYATIGRETCQGGALLRITFDDGLVGFADCHPWPELGDMPLDKQLEGAKEQVSTPLFAQSLYFARLDAEARNEQRSLFEDIAIPPSHQLLATTDDIDIDSAEGLTHFKLKCGHDPAREIAALSTWLNKHPDIRFRLDFNAKLSRTAFMQYFHGLPHDIRRALDFIEDPYPYHASTWMNDQKALKISFAADRAAQAALQSPQSADFIIHKPAIEAEPILTHSHTELVVTTYLDHPFGQMCAAFVAAKLKSRYPTQVGFCGLLTHKCYQSDPFLLRVHSKGPLLLAPEGTGFGFDTLLEEISWQNL